MKRLCLLVWLALGVACSAQAQIAFRATATANAGVGGTGAITYVNSGASDIARQLRKHHPGDPGRQRWRCAHRPGERARECRDGHDDRLDPGVLRHLPRRGRVCRRGFITASLPVPIRIPSPRRVPAARSPRRSRGFAASTRRSRWRLTRSSPATWCGRPQTTSIREARPRPLLRPCCWWPRSSTTIAP